jgi:hypothetical protein
MWAEDLPKRRGMAASDTGATQGKEFHLVKVEG